MNHEDLSYAQGEGVPRDADKARVFAKGGRVRGGELNDKITETS